MSDKKREWKFERTGGDEPWIPQGSYLGDTLICLGDTYEGYMDDCEFIERALACHADLVAALKAMTDKYCELVDSGDCGFWNSAENEEVIRARAALLAAQPTQETKNG